MADLTLSDKTTLVHGVWDTYRNCILYIEENCFNQKGTLLYIAEESYIYLIETLKRKGFELKHTTKNRRTGNKIFYYVREAKEEDHV